MHIQKHCVWVKCFSDVKDNESHRGKTNANPKINILMSEIIGQRRLNISSLESFDALYHHHFEPYYHLQSYDYQIIIITWNFGISQRGNFSRHAADYLQISISFICVTLLCLIVRGSQIAYFEKKNSSSSFNFYKRMIYERMT